MSIPTAEAVGFHGEAGRCGFANGKYRAVDRIYPSARADPMALHLKGEPSHYAELCNAETSSG